MNPERRAQIIAYNKAVAKNKEAAEDLSALLAALPHGQVKNLLKDETCASILKKYGIGGETNE